jgi:hypothetical protein
MSKSDVFYSNLSGGVGTFNRPRRMMTAEHLGAAHSRGKRKCKKCGGIFEAKTTGKYCIDCR